MAMTKKYLWRHPKGYWYIRIKGSYHRIRAPAHTPEFDREYWEVLTGKKAQNKRSFKALIQSYRSSERWACLKPRTRSDYEKVLIYLEDRVGPQSIERLTRKDILAAMEANTDRIRFANYIQQVLSIIFEHAIDIGWVDRNPAKGVRKLKTPGTRLRPHRPWPDWAVERFRNEARCLPRLIFEIGVGSVQRPGDWPKFRWSDYDGESLRIVQGKTGKSLWLPCTSQLRATLDRAPKTGLAILTTRDGRPLPYRRMAQIMRDERRRLDLLDFDLHALRYRGIMELAWADCRDDEIAAFSGHASTEMIRKYAGVARQEMRARSAALKRDRT